MEGFVHASGAYLWDSNGRRFVDYVLQGGAVVIGHADRPSERGSSGSRPPADGNPEVLAAELAETIARLVPSAQKVKLLQSGTQAIDLSVWIGQLATGRMRILIVGNSPAGFDPGHGAGRLEQLVLRWNDAETVNATFDRLAGQIAAVVCEPYVLGDTCAPPAPGFLELLRELTIRHGVVLVFDERRTGFRLHLGGYQAAAGVTPDLSVFGESLANGQDLGVVAGCAGLVELTERDSPGMAGLEAINAALETVRLLEGGGIDRLSDLGRRVREGLSQSLSHHRQDATVSGIGSAFGIRWRSPASLTADSVMKVGDSPYQAFLSGMRKRGHMLPHAPSAGFVCLATTEADVDDMIKSASEVLSGLET